MLTSLVLLPLLLASQPATAINAIARKGKYLYDQSTGSRFYIKGVAYQPQGEISASSAANEANGNFPEPSSYVDPLSSATNCTRDLPYLQQLGTNAVRVYSVNSSLDHDACMSTLSNAGIYVILDVALPLNGSIDRASPAWTTNLLDAYVTTIDAFLKYDNILAFNIGNEVVNLPSNTDAAPFVKAAARDTKAYLRSKGSQALVGYAAVDGDEAFRTSLATYLTCGNDTVDVDLYGLNNYEGIDGWTAITDDFSQLEVATYMSEYGSIASTPRTWTEVQTLYTAPVTNVFSGGLAFSYFPTSDGYGMVTFSGSDGQTVQTSTDFDNLASQLKNVTSPPNTPTQANSQVTSLTCSNAENSTFMAASTLPPTPDETVCNCINENSFSCRVTDATANNPAIVGALLDYTCSLLGSSGAQASCSNIGSNGTAGTYGALSYCSPAIKLSYAMSAYYESQSRNPQACDFSGNATAVKNRKWASLGSVCCMC